MWAWTNWVLKTVKRRYLLPNILICIENRIQSFRGFGSSLNMPVISVVGLRLSQFVILSVYISSIPMVNNESLISKYTFCYRVTQLTHRKAAASKELAKISVVSTKVQYSSMEFKNTSSLLKYVIFSLRSCSSCRSWMKFLTTMNVVRSNSTMSASTRPVVRLNDSSSARDSSSAFWIFETALKRLPLNVLLMGFWEVLAGGSTEALLVLCVSGWSWLRELSFACWLLVGNKDRIVISFEITMW